MSTLKDIFQTRAEIYQQQTNELIEHIRPNVIVAVNEYLKIDPESVQWRDVEHHETSDSIMVIGVFKTESPEAREQAQVPDDEDVYSILKVGVPLVLAEKGTKDEVKQFLRLDELASEDYEAGGSSDVNYEELVSTLLDKVEQRDSDSDEHVDVFTVDEGSDANIESDVAEEQFQKGGLTDVQNFDYNNLTEKQKVNLQKHSSASGGYKH